jgi:hypothetical protein
MDATIDCSEPFSDVGLLRSIRSDGRDSTFITVAFDWIAVGVR